MRRLLLASAALMLAQPVRAQLVNPPVNTNLVTVPAAVTADALAALSAGNAIVIDQPISLATSATLAGPVAIQGAGQITIAPGATLTFAQQPAIAADRQVFFGSGAVAGLQGSKAIWFAGSALNTATDAQAMLQHAIDATVTGGVVAMPAGSFTVSGTAPLTVTRGQKIRGQGKFTSQILYTSATSNVFALSGAAPGAAIESMTIGQPSDVLLANAGSAVLVSSSYATLTDVVVRSSYIAIEVTNHVTTTRITRPDLFDSQQIGLYIHDATDVYIDWPSVIAPFDRLVISGLTGTLMPNDKLVGQSSGATATIQTMVSAGTIKAYVDGANFTAGEVVKDTTSGATFTLSAQVTAHQLGAMRIKDQVEALTVNGGELFGGNYALTADAASNQPFLRPAYNKFVNVYMDSADNGALLNNSVEWDFTGCWWSSRPGYGLVVDGVDGIRFNGGGAVNNAKGGVYVTANAKHLVFANFTARGNSASQSGAFSGLTFAGATDFVVTGGTMGGSIGFGQQDYAVKIAGASDRYIVTNNLVSGNASGGVSDGGSGTNKTVANNF